MNLPRVLLVGCGGMSRAWLEALATTDATVVGLVDLDEANARRRAEDFGLSEAFIGTDLEAALAQLRPDAVFDVTIPEAHHAVTLAALRAGCHVLGEKPLADTLPKAREMVAAAAQAGKTYAVIQNRRYNANIRTVLRLLREGRIGRPHTFNADFYLAPRFGGFREKMRHVLLVDMAIHTFDSARYLSGKNATHVFCHEYNPPGSWYQFDASAMALFEMQDGVVFNYRGSWCATGSKTDWFAQWRILGDEGTLLWDGGAGIRICRPRENPEKPAFMALIEEQSIDPLPLAPEERGHAGLIREFLHCIRTGGTPMTVASDNIHSLAMVFGAVASAGQKQRVTVENVEA
ncbi:MAG: gfo/Idh/MocA family oxidoreductase [Puniceicoccaceae bacterium]|nr:MAG: gfo/Idh/MocA family oxidoreductase [Puniceicoccaceae bacterium]